MKKLHNSTFSFKGLSGTKKLLTAILLLLSYGSFAQYCTPGTWGGNSCSAAGNIYITTAKLSGTTFYSGGTCGSATGYNNLTGSVTCNVTAGQTYTIFLQSFDATSAYGTSFGAWMDFNGNQVYTDAGEAIIAPSAGNYIAAGGSLSITSASFTVPSGASGTTRMRVGVYGGQFGYGGVAMPCSASASYYGEYKDFTLIITPGTPCSGTPASLVVSPTAPSICSAASTNIALTLDASGYTYQWQQSNASNGTYVNVTGGSNATTATYTTPTGGSLPYSPTYYRCNVTCTASGQTTASQISTVSLNSFLNCYCSVSYAAANGGTRGIVQVILNGTPNINNSTAVNSVSPYYTQYTAASPVSNAGLSLSTSYALQVKVGTQANAINNVGAWIDYDQNGVFSSSEFIGSFTNAAASSTTTINFTVPGTASTGTTAMRIRHRYGAAVASTDACTAFSGAVGGGGSGETEDYRVNITGAACSATPTAGTVSASPTTVCPNATSVISLSGYTNGVSGITFQWQVSVNGGSYSNVSGGSGGTTATYTTSGLSNATLTSATYTYQCVVTCTNSGLSATSTTATVTVNPTPSVSVSPSSATICNSTGSQSLAASNAASGSTTYTWSPTTGLSPTSGSPVTASPSTTTTYTVTGTANTCTGTNTVIVTVNPTTVALTPSAPSIGIGSGVSITASSTSTNGAVTYSWLPNNGTLSSQTGATVTANPLSTTTYTVTATDPSGCSRTGTVTVTVTSGTPGLVSCGYSFSTASAYSSVAATSLGATGSVNYTLDLSGLATPFNFDYNGITYNVFGINGNGWMYFGGTSAPAANTTTPISSALAVDGVISAWSGMSGSTVGYLVSGSTPNRTLTIQWGASALAATIPNSTGFSCQIILYEHNPGGGGILIKFNLHMLINLMN